MKLDKIEERIVLPEGIEVKVEGNRITVKGPKGEVKRKLVYPRIRIEIKDKNFVLSASKPTKREEAMIGTFKAHIKNMLEGAKEGYSYKLKICASHFPMMVSVSGDEFVVKNLLGEKVPRKLKIKEGAIVKVEGDLVIVESIEKEKAGQVAADIEQLTKRTKYDRRIFQDGIYIIEKAGKKVK